MIKNYLITTLRSISRRRGFTILNVLGLSIGLAASLLILQYVQDEFSYDSFHANKNRIYRVEFDAYREQELIFKCATAFPKVAPMMKQDFPEVEDATRLYLRYGGGVVSHNEVSHKVDNLFQAEQNFFSIFSYPVIEGESKLDQPHTAVIEVETAKKFFGDENPVGKRIKFGTNEEYEITGVMESPENSHLKFSILFSYPTLASPEFNGPDFETAWGWYDFYTYVLLKEGSNPSMVAEKFPAFINKYGSRENESDRTKFVLQPLEDIHLYSDLIQEARVNGNGDSVYFLSIVAFFILVIAWVNYINLSTAKAVDRAKEVAVRKSIGANRMQLAFQFIGEAFFVNLIASLFGLMLLYTCIPLFNSITGKFLTNSIFLEPNLWMALGSLYFVGSLLSGLYPAFVLASYQPAKILKGTMKSSREGFFLRKTLVISQFVISVGLIAGTIVVYQQLNFMQNRSLGISIDKTIVINAPRIVADSCYAKLLDVYKNALRPNPAVKNVAATSEVPGNLIYWTNGSLRLGDDIAQRNQMYIVAVDYNFFDTFNNEFLSGRNFSPDYPSDSSSIIINEKAVEVFNLKSAEAAIGQKMIIGRDTFNVAGVIANYHQEGLKQDFRPTAFRMVENPNSYICVKFESEDLSQTIGFLKDQYASIFPNNPFDYFFLDTFFNRQYKNERQFGNVFGFFALLAIFVACLGLFGLASYTAIQRTKEIGIRKVMGSSASSIFLLLARDFIKLVIVANVLAFPIVWYLMDQWLTGFAFRTNLGVDVFIVAAIITSAIALLTVTYQSLSAALTNPVNSLRYE